jgi:hypothetical protein
MSKACCGPKRAQSHGPCRLNDDRLANIDWERTSDLAERGAQRRRLIAGGSVTLIGGDDRIDSGFSPFRQIAPFGGKRRGWRTAAAIRSICARI